MRIVGPGLVTLVVALAAIGCTNPSTNVSSCAAITCSGHGTCALVGGQPACTCDDGYAASGTDCVATAGCDPNPCTKVGQTRCTIENHQLVCGCDPGWHLVLEACVADTDSPCNPNPCTEAHQSVCAVEGTTARCHCDDGFIANASGACVSTDPCVPSPCTEAHKSVCANVGGSAVCSCDQGYTANSQGDCVQITVPCQPNPCTDPHRTVCTIVGGSAACGCDPGYQDDGTGACVVKDPCTPNPCTAAHQTVCTTVGSAAHCACDVGYIDDGTGACTVDTTGTCASQHSTGDSYEPDECYQIAQDLPVGATQSHTIEPAGDNDWFKTTLVAGHSYHYEVSPLDVEMYLVAADGTTVLDSTDEPQTLDVTPAADAVYYLRVRHYYSTSTGSYIVTLADYGTDDGDDAGHATAVTVGTPRNATLSPAGDNDWFSFPTVAGHIYSVTTTGADTYIYVVDTDGTTVLSETDFPPLYLTATGAGPYFVRVRHYSTTGTGGYTLTITDLGADDHGNDAAHATPVTVGANVPGSIMPAGDEDWFSWSATAGHIYSVTTTGTDTYLYVVDTDGTTVLKEGDYPPIYATAATSGTYFVRVRHYSATSTGDYTLTITDLGADDHGNDAAHATPVTAGVGVGGVVEAPTDSDWFSFSAVAGHIVDVMTTGADTYVYLIATDGTTVLKESDTVPLDAMLATAGTYYVRVRLTSTTATGSYTLTITDLGPDDHGDDAAHATLVVPEAPPGTPVAGRIEIGGDNDWFAFDATAGHIYKCTTTGTLDTYVYLVDTDGTTALKSQDDPTVFLSAATSGRYYYRVRAYYATTTGAYAVVITDEGTDDFPNGPVGAPTVAVGTPIAGSIEVPGDVDWVAFAAEAGATYRIVLQGATGLDTIVDLYDPTGATSLAHGDDPEPATITKTLAAAGTYFVRVALYSSTASGTYTLTIAEQ